ncbi:FGGY carbohydrate kinase domain-containing protein-like isoform X1 [Ciona intestinalis]
MVRYYIGVDVGSHSVRAGLVDNDGTFIATAEEGITVVEPKTNQYIQSSDEIWRKCCSVIKSVVKNVDPSNIQGIGFDATCSLVVLDHDFKPVPLTNAKSNNDDFNIIMWMDHRAKEEADFINSTNHEVLKFVGGKISLEMQPPKLLWIKKNQPECWTKAHHFFDLSDFLTFKCTNSLTRSSCAVTCKWLYSSESGWNKSFWKEIGLEDLNDNNFSKIGNVILPPGTAIKGGLTQETASDMGLLANTAVAVAMIDAHCGGLAAVGVGGHDLNNQQLDITECMAVICGTSSCHMGISSSPIFVPGVWGPYYSAMIPKFWLSEGGQTASGKLIDHIVQTDVAFPQLKQMAKERGKNIYHLLNDIASQHATDCDELDVDVLTRNIHIHPDHHGNRSPLADPTLCGAVCGLTLDTSLQHLALLYIATMQALAFGSRHIIETMEKHGHQIKAIFMCGGLSKNELFVQIHANVLERPVVLGKESETMLLGGCILAACASRNFPSIQDAMKSMCHSGGVVHPNSRLQGFYQKKYKVFLAMIKNQQFYMKIMNE